MPTTIDCPTPKCKSRLSVPDAGGEVACEACKKSFQFLSKFSYKRLEDFGRRLVLLLDHGLVQKTDPVKAAIDDLLGAVYSLIHAKQQDFQERTGKTQYGVVRTRAQQIQLGIARTDGRWIAGWHFNSALYRLSAVYHRLLKSVTGDYEQVVADLLPKAEFCYCKWTRNRWTNSHIGRIHQEVNLLKHDKHGIYSGRRATLANAESAIGELLMLLEAWVNAPKSRK